jgi:leader peptidase (prepilin peptidase)/N-methyltransferase
MGNLLLGLTLNDEGYVMPTITVSLVLAGMVVLAVLDVWREEVEDYGIVVLAGVAVIGVHLEGIRPEQWLGAFLAAAIAFLVYFDLGLKGGVGGGDVKLSLVPAFALGAGDPLIGMWWIIGSLLIQAVLSSITTRVQKAPAAMPHVPAMALATLILSIAIPANL